MVLNPCGKEEINSILERQSTAINSIFNWKVSFSEINQENVQSSGQKGWLPWLLPRWRVSNSMIWTSDFIRQSVLSDTTQIGESGLLFKIHTCGVTLTTQSVILHNYAAKTKIACLYFCLVADINHQAEW